MENQNPTPNPAPPTENIPTQNPPVQETPSSQVYTSPQPVSPPPFPKSFLSNKIILLIVILLMLLGIGGTYLALNSKSKPQSVVSKPTPTSAPTPLPTEASAKAGTPDPTANWKTLAPTVFVDSRFSFKYTPFLNVISEGTEGQGTVLGDTKNTWVFWITFINKENGQDLENFATSASTNSVYGGGIKVLNRDKISIDNNLAYKNELQMEDGKTKIQVLVEDPNVKNAIYNIQLLDKNLLGEKTFDQIL